MDIPGIQSIWQRRVAGSDSMDVRRVLNVTYATRDHRSRESQTINVHFTNLRQQEDTVDLHTWRSWARTAACTNPGTPIIEPRG